jgi:predicted transcriptional regulator
MSESIVNEKDQDEILGLVADIVTAYVSNNTVSAEELPSVIQSVHSTLSILDAPEIKTQPAKPAVSIRKSYTDEYIVCLEDGKKLKMLKRYLRSRYNMSPEEYRAKWGLPENYPMVAPNYAAKRSEFAKKIGLGKRGKGAA